jgi:MFS family permease
MFVIGTGLQEQQGYTPFAAGLAFLPQGLAVGLISTFAATAATRWSPRILLLTGTVVLTAGQLLYTGTLDQPYATRLLPACLLVGAGIAGLYPAATMLASAAATADQQATASGLLTTCQQAGGALGVALVAAVGGGGEGLWVAAATMLGTLLAVVSLSLLRYPEAHRSERQRASRPSHSDVIDSSLPIRPP